MNNRDLLKLLSQEKAFLGQILGENKKTRTLHPTMNNFVLGNRKNIYIISSKHTLKNMIKSFYIILSVIKKNGHILIVNTNLDVSNLISYFKTKTKGFEKSFSYCNEKWVGGTLTNWKQISSSILTYISFSKKFGKYITKNNIHFPRYKKLKKDFQGFMHISHTEETSKGIIYDKNPTLKKPDLLLVINPNENIEALCEAKNLDIPVIAFTDTDTDLALVTYPIPINSNSLPFIHYYLSWILKAIHSKNIQ